MLKHERISLGRHRLIYWAQMLLVFFGLPLGIVLVIHFLLKLTSQLGPNGVSLGLLVMGVLILLIPRLWRARPKPRGQDILSPYQLMSVTGEADQWTQLWLCPLTPRDLIGISVGWLYYVQRHRRSHGAAGRWIKRLGWGIGLTAVAAVLPLLAGGFHGALTFVTLIAFLAGFFLLWNQPIITVNQALDLAQSMFCLRGGQATWKLYRRRPVMMLLMILFILNVMLIFSLFLMVRGEPAWVGLEVSLICWAGVFVLCSLHIRRVDPQQRFQKLVERDGREWQDEIARLVGRDA